MSALETGVAEQLAKINSEDSEYDSTLDKPDEDDNSLADDSQAGSTIDEPDDSTADITDATDGATDDSSNDDGNGTEDTGDDDSGVPDAYLRAAVHQGWKEEEVEELWKEDQEKAERLLKANLTATNNLSSQWSQLGQQQMDSSVPPATPAVTPAVPNSLDTEKFAGLDIDKLKAEYDDDDNLINTVVKPMNDLLIKINAKLETVESQQNKNSAGIQKEQAAANQEKKEAIGQQIDTFFDSLKSEEFKKFYGTGSDWAKFEDGQAENRIKLLTQADQIKAGAAYQNKEIDNETAMGLANLILSSSLAEQKIISDIKNSLTKREKSLSLKPSGSRASSISDGKKDKSEKGLIKTLGTFMKNRGIKQY